MDAINGRLAPTPGTCTVMGTASTMACIAEALGMALPGSAAIPATHADRIRCAEQSGAAAVATIEPMASRVGPGRVQAAHQSLHHFVASPGWSDDAMLAAVRGHVLPIIEQRGRVRGWMIDDTGIPKKGIHSVGVALHHCGQLGKQDSCQVAVTLSLAADHASLPIAHRLYLPQAWAEQTKVPAAERMEWQIRSRSCNAIRPASRCAEPSGEKVHGFRDIDGQAGLVEHLRLGKRLIGNMGVRNEQTAAYENVNPIVRA